MKCPRNCNVDLVEYNDYNMICKQCNYVFNKETMKENMKRLESNPSAITELPLQPFKCNRCRCDLFQGVSVNPKGMHVTYCFPCAAELEDKAWKYDDLCK